MGSTAGAVATVVAITPVVPATIVPVPIVPTTIVPVSTVPATIVAIADVAVPTAVRDHRHADRTAHGAAEDGTVAATEFTTDGCADGRTDTGADNGAAAVVPGVRRGGGKHQEQGEQGCADHGNSPSVAITCSLHSTH
jgi:hypothetical protein